MGTFTSYVTLYNITIFGVKQPENCLGWSRIEYNLIYWKIGQLCWYYTLKYWLYQKGHRNIPCKLERQFILYLKKKGLQI